MIGLILLKTCWHGFQNYTHNLRKRSSDPNPEKPLTESEQVKIKKMMADEADISEMRKRNNDPDQPLTEPE